MSRYLNIGNKICGGGSTPSASSSAPSSETWEEIALSLGAIGIYRADTGVTLSGGGYVQTVNDLSGNGNHLTDSYAESTQSEIVSGRLKTTASTSRCFRGSWPSMDVQNIKLFVVGEFYGVPASSLVSFLTVYQNGTAASSSRLGLALQNTTPEKSWTNYVGISITGPANWRFNPLNIVETYSIEVFDNEINGAGGFRGYETKAGASFAAQPFSNPNTDQPNGNIIGLGGAPNKGLVPDFLFDGWVVFDQTLDTLSYENQIRILLMRKLMKEEFE